MVQVSRAERFLLLLIILSVGCSGVKVVKEVDPLTPEEHLSLGYVYERRGEYELALEHYRKASASVPEALLAAGNLCYRTKRYEDAEMFYRKAMRHSSVAPDAMNNLAWLYCTLGKRLKEAEALIQQALKERPEREAIYRDTLKCIREKLGDTHLHR